MNSVDDHHVTGTRKGQCFTVRSAVTIVALIFSGKMCGVSQVTLVCLMSKHAASSNQGTTAICVWGGGATVEICSIQPRSNF